MNITVLYFGPSEDWSGVATEIIDVDDASTLDDLTSIIIAKYQSMAPAINSVRFAVNQNFASGQTVLHDGDEVAIVPPVSGGLPDDSSIERDTSWVILTPDPIDVGLIRQWVCNDVQFGGIVTFDGVTRGAHDVDHGELIYLDYSSYDGMAIQEMQKLVDAALASMGVGRIAMIHRTGRVAPGETSVTIVVASAHRAQAFEACRWLIDRLKEDVPIWKKDVFSDGFKRWVDLSAHQKQSDTDE